MVRLVSGVIYSLAMIAIGFAISSTTSLSYGGDEASSKKDYLNPPPALMNGNCTAEQTAYNTAVVDYQDAEQAVQDAYDDWYDCEMGGGAKGPDSNFVNPITSDDSILVK